MKTKVEKLIIPYLSLVLILSNFSFATTLAFCSMGGDSSCACEKINDTGKHGLVINTVSKSCCEAKTIELSNSNILEIIFSSHINPLASAQLINTCDNTSYNFTSQVCSIINEISYHPPNSEIPVINSSLLI